MINKFLATVLLSLISAASWSQTTCDSLILLKQKVYGFKPSELSDSLKDLKSSDLDVFWATARANSKDAAPCLKSLIENETKDLYFCFDASSLLLRLDTTDKYLQTVIDGLNKCDVADLQLESYLQICFYLGYKGKDIGGLTTRLISIPDAQIYLTNHVITLNAIDASIFLFNTMPTATAERVLVSAIMNGNVTAKHNAAAVLNLLSTTRGDSLINSLIAKGQLADSTIEFIRGDRKAFIVKAEGSRSRSEVLESLNDVPYNMAKNFFGFAGNDDLIGSACKQLTKDDIEKVRSARLRSTPGLSDEALDEYFALTSILMTIRNQ